MSSNPARLKKLHSLDNRCTWCARETFIDHSRHWDWLHASLDHLYPKGHPMRGTANSTVLSCRKCNNIRGSLPYMEFAALWAKEPPFYIHKPFDLDAFQNKLTAQITGIS